MSVSDSDDSVSLNSILHVKAAELYPKKKLVETPDNASIPIPFSTVCGEAIEYIGRIVHGVLALSNYRLYFQRTGRDGKGDFNIPLGLIEIVEVKELFHLSINCKDARTYRCSFPSNDVCMDWTRKISRAVHSPRIIDEIFAFVYFMWSFEEGGEEVRACLGKDHTITKDYFLSEYERMRFQSDTNKWRISFVNNDYNLCTTYPRRLIFPASFSDQAVMSCAKFRCSQRLPAVVWRHKENGMIIARSAQPEVGFFYWRSNDDEELLKLLSECCVDRNQPKPRLLVLDARSYTSAVANRARGGGSECIEYYPNIELHFLSLVNIHYIRKSFHALRQLCAQPPDSTNWHSGLENTRWLCYLSGLIEAAIRIVTAIEKDSRPVLVHCSDGWDRTAQMVSLAEILLDPYYRTIEGFQVLCEREWLDFGHKFADRCGMVDNPNEKSPVFLQWLDCVHNLMEQFPCAFEFSRRYLIKLAEHVYSNLFGTFLCNSHEERQRLSISQRTYSVWRYLDAPHFRNYLYDKNFERVLWPRYATRDLVLWRDLYIDYGYDNHISGEQLTVNENAVSVANNSDRNNMAPDTDGGSLNNFDNNIGSMLESAINCQPESGSDSGMGTNDENENKPGLTTQDEEEDRPTADEQVTAIESKLQRLLIDSIDPPSNASSSPPNLINFDSSMSEEAESAASNEDDIKVVTSTVTMIVNAIVDGDADVEATDTTHAVQENGASCGDERTNYASRENEILKREDCDILPRSRDIEVAGISEDCNLLVAATEDNEDTELDNRLNGADVSVQTSVETVIDGRCVGPAGSSLSDLFEYKTVFNGFRNYELSSCTNGRQQLSSLLLDPIDGLPLIPDDIQDRLQQISIEHKAKLAAVSNELHKTRYTLMTKICNQCTHQNGIVADKPTVCDDDKGSVCSTEISWEAVDDKDVGGQVLWVPDHAVSHCTACNSRFWLGRRRHHCRGCGKIFCADCSRNVTSLPNEQLYSPVRVCGECYHTKRIPASCLSYNSSPRQTTCKQAAAGEEQRNSNLLLPPTSPF